MDGNTAVTTIAADIAASRGIVVVVSAGNEGLTSWEYIDAPADGDSVIAVGGVNAAAEIWLQSSLGPTSDFRIKPEVVAMGVNVWAAVDEGGFNFFSGTSLSAPLISGVAGLILQANPDLRGNPMKIRDRLIKSSDRYDSPDNRYGYGLPNAVLAAGFGLRILPIPMISIPVNRDTTVLFNTLAPVGEMVTLEACDIPPGSIFTDQGNGSATLWYRGDRMLEGPAEYCLAATAGEYSDTLYFLINTVTTPVPFHVGPNPFSDSLIFYLNQQFTENCKIEIFTINGEMVFRAYNPENPFTWKGTNEWGGKVASGVYFIRFSADGIEERVKVLKL
jgi:hypothetical protein